MSDFKPKPGSFSAYLDYMQRNKTAGPAASSASPLTLLEILVRQVEKVLPMPDLQTLSGMDPARFSEAIKGLRDEGYVSIDEKTLAVKLTDQGAAVARLSRPA